MVLWGSAYCKESCKSSVDEIKLEVMKNLKEDMNKSFTVLKTEINELKLLVKSVRNPPFESYCGYNYNSKDSTTLTYSSPLLHSSTNLGRSGICPPGGCPAQRGLNP